IPPPPSLSPFPTRRSSDLRQFGTLLSVLPGGHQVIPFVEYTGQAKMRFASHPLRRITGKLQAAPVALCRQIQLVVCFLYLAQIRSEEHTSELQSREKLVCR